MNRAVASLFAIVVAKFRFRFGACEPMRIHLLESIKQLFLGCKHRFCLLANLVELADEIGSKRAVESGLRTGHDSFPKNLNVISRAPETNDAVPIAATQEHGNPEYSVGQLTQRRSLTPRSRLELGKILFSCS